MTFDSRIVKPVGEPDAGNPQVRFDERGTETELWKGMSNRHMAKAAGNSENPSPKTTSPFFDSTDPVTKFVKNALFCLLYSISGSLPALCEVYALPF